MKPAQSLYDLSPVGLVMLVGLLLAIGPLAWVWLRHRRAAPAQRLQALTLLTLFLTFDLVLFGAFTRLTDSGLGCPDWPGCYGNASPVGAHAQISAAQQVMPTGPVTHGKAWVEMVHRYLATGVGALTLALAAFSWAQHAKARRDGRAVATPSPWWATLTLLWVCVQGAFGALTVTMKLFPAIVTLHLLGGLVLLALLAVQAVRYARANGADMNRSLSPPLHRLLWAGMLLLTLQIALGGWVSTNYAVLACTEFPLCQGSWWPEMNFAQGFELWRPLGQSAQGGALEFSALTAIHYAHRLAAYGVIAVLAVLALRMYACSAWRTTARVLAAVLLLQFLTGLSNVVLGWPLLAALLHTGGAAALVVVLVWSLALARSRSAAASRTAFVSSLPA